MKPFSIYYLIDPVDKTIRYVGYSCKPEARYVVHVLQSSECRTHKECWIAGLRQRDLFPLLSIQCIVQGAAEAKRVEISLIAKLRQRGADLVNGTHGGDGFAGGKWSEENRRKHEAYWNAVGRQEASKRRKGIPLSESHVKAVIAANTPELLARRGAAIKAGWAKRKGIPTKNKGRHSGRQPSLGRTWSLTDDQKQNHRNSWTPERRAKQAERMRQRHSKEDPEIAAERVLRRELARTETYIAKLKAALLINDFLEQKDLTTLLSQGKNEQA